MATQVQFRRGTTAQNNSFTGALGEVTVDTDKDTVVVHDGGTAGGFPLARQDGSNMTGISITTGTVKLDGNYPVGTGNVALGDTAGDSIASDGNYNTLIGANAGTAITTGDNNTAVGYQAGYSNTTASFNTFIGRLSGYTNTTGSQLVSVGTNALRLNTTGEFNTAIGKSALEANTTGTVNTAVGSGALVANTTASYNTGIGRDALGANTTGASNTAVGEGALDANTTADNNTAVGRDALGANTTASENTAVGYQSMVANTTGANNTALGINSLGVNTSGGNNTALGRLALYNNTTASNNVSIGNSSMQLNTTGTQNVAVGASALSANTTANNNTAVGYATLTANTTGAQNVAIGTACMTANTTGNDSICMGVSALDANTTGGNHVALGRQALQANTTGINNTAVGLSALVSNTTGSSSTAIGYQAGYSQTATGSVFNTFVGNVSGYSTTSGTRNSFFGHYSGQGNTTGDYNTYIGQNSGYLMTTGNYNIILGSYSGNAGGLDIRTSNDYIVLSDGQGNPRGIFDGSGNFLVGKTTLDYDTPTGHVLRADGFYSSVRSGGNCADFNRLSSDGEIIRLSKDGSTVGSIGTQGSTRIYIGTFNGSQPAGIRFVSQSVPYVAPSTSNGGASDNLQDLGAPSERWDDVYATNGTIQTSDRNEKQDIEELSEAEQRVAVVAKGLMRKFRWKSAVAEKGDNARTHFGIIAQDLQDAFTAEGLDADDYAMFTSNTWWEKEISVDAVEADEANGIEAKDAYTYMDTKDEATESYTEKTRLGVRYNQLLAFIISAI